MPLIKLFEPYEKLVNLVDDSNDADMLFKIVIRVQEGLGSIPSYAGHPTTKLRINAASTRDTLSLARRIHKNNTMISIHSNTRSTQFEHFGDSLVTPVAP